MLPERAPAHVVSVNTSPGANSPVQSRIVSTAKFPGRSVVAGCFLSLTVTSGLSFYGLAVYLNAFSKERGWTLSSISLATTVFFLTGGIVGTFVARAIARTDVRKVMLIGALSGGLALLLLGQVRSPWLLYLDYVLFAFGFSAAGLIPVTTVVTRWYVTGRSVALSIASTGLSVGGMILTPLAKWMTDEIGLARATPILAAIWLIGTVPVILLMIKPDPGLLGWLPDGRRAEPNVAPSAPTGMSFADGVRTRFFRLMALGFVLLMGAQVGGLQQIVKLAEDRTGATAAAFVVLVVSVMSVVGRLFTGRNIHKAPMGLVTVLLGTLQGLTLVALAFAHTTWVFFACAAVFGATVGNILMMQSLIISEHFGVRDYARLFSRLQLVVMLGTAGGPFLLGWLHDVAGSYLASYVVAGALSIAGAATMWLAGPVGEYAEPQPTDVAERA